MLLYFQRLINDDISGMFDNIVEVKVALGRMQKSFVLPEGLLRHYSGYFEATLGGNFAESKTKVIELKEERIETFERFVLWLYTGKFHRFVPSEPDFRPICELWVLGDRRQIPLLTNQMINTVRNEVVKCRKVPTVDLQYIYQNTTPDAKLRAFAIWVISNTGSASIANVDNHKHWPEEATFDLLQAIWKLKETGTALVSNSTLAEMDMCSYHQHGKDVRCSTNPD